ncbi:MAG: AAA family ATPase [Paludibaculum sp.]
MRDTGVLIFMTDRQDVAEKIKAVLPNRVDRWVDFAGADLTECGATAETDNTNVILVCGGLSDQHPTVLRCARKLARFFSAIYFVKVNPDLFCHTSAAEVKRCLDDARLHTPGRSASISKCDLLRANIPPVKWCIQGMVPAIGLAMVVARPKARKSWFALCAALAVERGVKFGGYAQTSKAAVLAYFLEDGVARIGSRLQFLGGKNEPGAAGITFRTSLPGLDDELEDEIRAAVAETKAKFLVIDPFVRISPEADRSDLFRGQYLGLSRLRDLAVELEIAILLVHHTRKPVAGMSDSPVDSALGTTGISAAVDSIIAIAGTPANPIVHVVPRDAEAIDLAARFSQEGGGWELLGSVEKASKRNQTQMAILEALKKYGPLQASEIATRARLVPSSVRRELANLRNDGRVEKPGKEYVLLPEEDQEPQE